VIFPTNSFSYNLEHLIFLGSRKYPQHGYLDHIAAQYYSLGTNATTHKDMTTYELTTISHNSLAVLLPIFLDHVFNPLLKNDCYLTEVHHISGETGDDAGVVYSEMQSIENQPNEILALSIFRDLWSEKSLYHYESAGILESIRNELTLDKIKLFHSKFYIPNNVAIVLCGGGINIDEIVQLLTKFEEENFLRNENHQRISIDQCFNENQRKKAKFNDEKFPFIQIKRPSFDDNSLTSDTITKPNPISIDSKKLAVQTTTTDGNESSFCDSELMVSHEDLSAPPSPSSVLPTIETDNSTYQRNMNEYKEICYPVDDSNENLGQVAFGYRLESVYDIETYQALDVLLTTLSDDDISIFYKEFIEIPNTLCSTISHGWDDCPERVLTITFEG
jgi:Zn-dependent M16 (insulinase) family peptidase